MAKTWTAPDLIRKEQKMQFSYTPSQNIRQAQNIPENDEKNIVLPISREPGRVPSQVPSADLRKIFYKHYKLWSRRAA